MSGTRPEAHTTPNISRRRFIEGLATSGVRGTPSWAKQAAATVTGDVPQPSGKEFDLTIAQTVVNFTGSPRLVTTLNGSIPTPTLRWREGETVTIKVTNRLNVSTSIHWHGIILPYKMDGVPGISYAGIAPGTSFTYRFKVQQTGTYWCHSHTGFQEQTGMYGAIIVEPAAGEPIRAERDYVVQLSDWTDEEHSTMQAASKNSGQDMNHAGMTSMSHGSMQGVSAPADARDPHTYSDGLNFDAIPRPQRGNRGPALAL